jgi:hypothetical protein
MSRANELYPKRGIASCNCGDTRYFRRIGCQSVKSGWSTQETDSGSFTEFAATSTCLAQAKSPARFPHRRRRLRRDPSRPPAGSARMALCWVWPPNDLKACRCVCSTNEGPQQTGGRKARGTALGQLRPMTVGAGDRETTALLRKRTQICRLGTRNRNELQQDRAAARVT